jgi:hypothetical protein
VLDADPPPIDVLAALLRGEHVQLGGCGLSGAALVEACVREELTGLVYEQLSGAPGRYDWPTGVQEELARQARTDAAQECVRQQEIIAAIDGLTSKGVHPVLLKGTALAYSAYATPCARPRSDTDLFIRRDEVDTARRAMGSLGYTEPPFCDGELLFCQFHVARQDRFGVDHAFDFHWKISTQPVFADLLTYADLCADAVPVPALGAHARAAGPLHALLIACIHPAMHHRNVERLLWVYDVHLLAGRLSEAEWDRFAELALARNVAAVSAEGLARARARLRTRFPDRVIARLSEPGHAEPSAAYLRPGRRWTDEVVSSIGGLPRWRDRFRLLGEILFPSPRYMRTAYGLDRTATPLLPALYAHRILKGAWKLLTGRK